MCASSFFGKIQIFGHFLTKNYIFINFDLPQIPHLQLSANLGCAPCQRTCSASKLPQDFLLLSALLRTFTNLCFSFFSLHVLGKNLTISTEYNTKACKNVQKQTIYPENIMAEHSINVIVWVSIFDHFLFFNFKILHIFAICIRVFWHCVFLFKK